MLSRTYLLSFLAILLFASTGNAQFLKQKQKYSIGINLVELAYKNIYLSAERLIPKYMGLGLTVSFQDDYEKDGVTRSGTGLGLYLRRYSSDFFFVHGGLTGGTRTKTGLSSYSFLMAQAGLGFKFPVSLFFLEPMLLVAPAIRLESFEFEDRWLQFAVSTGIRF